MISSPYSLILLSDDNNGCDFDDADDEDENYNDDYDSHDEEYDDNDNDIRKSTLSLRKRTLDNSVDDDIYSRFRKDVGRKTEYCG